MLFTRALVFSAVALIPSVPAHAQTPTSEDEIRVIGTYAGHKGEHDISPIQSVDRDDILAIGATSVKDIVQTLTINSGAENQPDAFTQSATSGTSNINLRGLGLSSTLVLLNGRRTTRSAATTNSGVAFVDTNSLLPDIALDRIEILKDGASPLYGSDAVAGVVNFVTRRDFTGLELQADFQSVNGTGSSDDLQLQALWGQTSDRVSVLLAGGYQRVTELDTTERRLSVYGRDDVSSLGNPASFFVSPDDVPSLSGPTPYLDPYGCEEFGGIAASFGPVDGVGTPGLCRFDFGAYFNLVPQINKWEAYTAITADLSHDIQFWAEVGFASVETVRGNSPSFPVLTQPQVPASHPENPFGFDVGYFGRILGNGAPRFDTPHASETWRVATGLSGEVSSTQWEVSVVHARNDHRQEIRDTVAARLTLALQGLGGADCDAVTDTPGAGACQYFNPFATSFTTAPNDPALTAYLMENQVRTGDATATILEAVISQPLFPLAGGAARGAFGYQYRDEGLSLDYDDLSNADAFTFLIGNPDNDGALDVHAVFGEALLPLTQAIEIQAALRYETYGEGVGDTLNPKLGIVWRPAESLALRASWSTSFRAPSVFQKDGISTILNQASDPITGTTSFVGDRSIGNPALKPERSENFNAGIIWASGDLRIEADYWQFSFDDVIVQENYQAVLNAFPQDPERVIRAGDPLTGPVVQINTTRVNANSLDTAGVDVSLTYDWQTAIGRFSPSFETTYVDHYNIDDPQAGMIEGVGRRNFTNTGTAMPQWRWNAGLGYARGQHQAHLFVRHIDEYVDDQNATPEMPRLIDGQTTMDAQYVFDLGTALSLEQEVQLTVGAINLTDEYPPAVQTNGGYDTKVHDPRGRVLYAQVRLGF